MLRIILSALLLIFCLTMTGFYLGRGIGFWPLYLVLSIINLFSFIVNVNRRFDG